MANITNDEKDYSIYNQNIIDVKMGDYIEKLSVLYGVNVSLFRACPMIIDGLTPGQRRRLYTFYTKGSRPNKPRFKANDLLGPVGALHPHGDMSIENSFKNDIKPWESNVELFDTHGNKGSMTGETAAATRYLETRLSKYAMKCFFDDFDTNIVDMTLSNTRRDHEPVFIPSKYPHYLFTTTTGIAWGNAVDLPPFNVNEVCELTKSLMDNPEMTNVYLYPDSPRGYDIIATDNIVDLCNGGRGSIKTQSRMDYHVEEVTDPKTKKTTEFRYLDVSGFSPQITMDSIMKKISKLVLDKAIDGIADIEDRTHLSDVKFRIILTENANEVEVINTLYRKTTLRHFVKLNFNFATRTHMQQNIGLKDTLLYWIDNAIDMKHRIYSRKAVVLREKISELQGIIVMLEKDNLENTINIIRYSESDSDAIASLVNHYKDYEISSFQANKVLDLGLRKLNRTAKDKFVADLENNENELKKVSEILHSPDKIKDLIKRDLDECMLLFGKPRQCRIIPADSADAPVYTYNVLVTKKYIKKLSPKFDSYGIMDGEDDILGFYKDIPESAVIYIVDNFGKVRHVKLTDIRGSELTAKGVPLTELFPGAPGIPIRAFKILNKNDISETDTLIMFLKSGIAKRSPLNQYLSNRSMINGITLNANDDVSYAVVYQCREGESHNVLVYTKQGLGIVVDIENILVTDRTTKGARYFEVLEGDEIQAMTSISDINDKLLVITEKGYIKFCTLADIFITDKKRTSMKRITSLVNDDKVLKIIPWNDDKEEYNSIECILASGNIIQIDISDINKTTRLSKGKKTIPVKRGDSIVKIRLI